MRAGQWGGVAVALLLCVAFAHFCVRIVPEVTDAAPQEPVDAGPLLIPVEGVPPSALTDTFT
ncbi:MAG: M23 family peptidase, partial [Sphingobium sp.]